jgi:hypothetical protein
MWSLRYFIGINIRTCMSICVCTVFLKKSRFLEYVVSYDKKKAKIVIQFALMRNYCRPSLNQ